MNRDDLLQMRFYAANLIFDSPECQKYSDCSSACKACAICYDIGSTRQYIWKKIKERELLESISRM